MGLYSSNGSYERRCKESDRRPSRWSSARISQTLFPLLWWPSWYNGEIYLHGASRPAGDREVRNCQVQGDVTHRRTRTKSNETFLIVFKSLSSTSLVYALQMPSLRVQGFCAVVCLGQAIV